MHGESDVRGQSAGHDQGEIAWSIVAKAMRERHQLNFQPRRAPDRGGSGQIFQESGSRMVRSGTHRELQIRTYFMTKSSSSKTARALRGREKRGASGHEAHHDFCRPSEFSGVKGQWIRLLLNPHTRGGGDRTRRLRRLSARWRCRQVAQRACSGSCDWLPCGHVFQGSSGETLIFQGRFPLVVIGVRGTLHRPLRVATEWHCQSIDRRLHPPHANAGCAVDCMRFRD